jgi:hypothetical protein
MCKGPVNSGAILNVCLSHLSFLGKVSNSLLDLYVEAVTLAVRVMAFLTLRVGRDRRSMC